MTAQEFQQVAVTIINQLGGKRFMAMTGIKSFVSLTNTKFGGVSMKLPANKSKANYFEITLEWDDTYTLKFGAIRGVNYTVLNERTSVYAEDLQRVFTEVTGLYTSL